MSTIPFDILAERLSSLKLGDTLIYFSRVLKASQNPDIDKTIYAFAQDNPTAITDFKIEFLAKWLIIKSNFTSPEIYSPTSINQKTFLELITLYEQIDDPIVHDPDFANRNPVEFFIRLGYQQIASQKRILLQSYGSAYLLFQEAAAKLADKIGYNIPERFEQISRLTIRQFMALGQVFFSAHLLHDTVTPKHLENAHKQGVGILTSENVENFLNLVACDYQRFRQVASQKPYAVDDPAYFLYEFNPLNKFPLIQIGKDEWTAPNPYLIIDRVTRGIYYDLLDADGVAFKEQALGQVFEEYIGILLKYVYQEPNVCREKTYGQPEQKGPADWTVIEGDTAILIECKSLVPRLDFNMLASQGEIQYYAKHIANNAVISRYRQIEAIQAGVPELQEFAGKDTKIVVLTLGAVQTGNSIFFKKEIDNIIVGKGINNLSYVIISLQEFEHLLSLVERGVTLTELLARLEGENQGKALDPYQDLLTQSAVPSLVARKGEEIIRSFRA